LLCSKINNVYPELARLCLVAYATRLRRGRNQTLIKLLSDTLSFDRVKH